jgi:hypothetical protein
MSTSVLSALIMKAFDDMPNTLNTKKEIDEFYKKAMKECNDKMKEEKKGTKEGAAPRKALGVKAAKAAPKKRVKKAEVDADGNEIEKVKKPLNAYQQYMRDNRQTVKDENPGLSNEDYFRLLASNWKKLKENKEEDKKEEEKDDDKEKEKEDKKEEEKDDDNEEDKDDKKDEDDKTEITVVKDDKKEKKEKKDKKEKKEKV